MNTVYRFAHVDLTIKSLTCGWGEFKADDGREIRVKGPANVRVHIRPLNGSISACVLRLRYRLSPSQDWTDLTPIVQFDSTTLYNKFPAFVTAAPELALQITTIEGSALFADISICVDELGAG